MMSELKAYELKYGAYGMYLAEDGHKVDDNFVNFVYPKDQMDKVIADLEESHKMEVEQLLMEIVKLKGDYKEACDRLHTAGLIKDEQKAKADKLLSCLKCLVMRDLIKDCPEKSSAVEIVKEYDKWTR